VRIRIDGACQVYQTIPYAYRNAIVSRLKIMSDLDIAERRKPQDGKIKFKKYGGLDIELRVATVPTQGGMEDIVMRILAAGEPIPLDKMGFSQRNYDNFVSIITKPYGIVFVCGPTGSGKTTTLHSALGYINKVDTKIWTAEDPVEITQKGLRQVQVQKKIGFDFAMAMRAFLRADPDVIMVGEMRDKETTSIGIEASLTGHLVFSTLHTNSAPESITRLLDMGMDPFNFSDAILGILAQRLGRTMCKKCKEPYHPPKEAYDELVREYGGLEKFQKLLNIPYTDELTFNKPVGCAKCNNSGYAGRCGIHELLMGTDPMKKLIQLTKPMEELKAQALKDGMTTLKQDGIGKVFSGLLDLTNVRKVCIE
jgi:type II secretory ATPase GspE/PulE/Tfp pilus assembly ATPase PilB-like protein